MSGSLRKLLAAKTSQAATTIQRQRDADHPLGNARPPACLLVHIKAAQTAKNNGPSHHSAFARARSGESSGRGGSGGSTSSTDAAEIHFSPNTFSSQSGPLRRSSASQ